MFYKEIQARVIINNEMNVLSTNNGKSITLIFWNENVEPKEQELLEDQIFELRELFRNDPKYKEYEVSVTKSLQ